MPRYQLGGTGLIHFSTRLFSNKSVIFIFLIICPYVMYSQKYGENVGNDTGVTPQTLVRKSRNIRLKYILLWMDPDNGWIFWPTEQRSFINDNCSRTNCFLTYNRELLRDIRKFHAVIFHGQLLNTPLVIHKRKSCGSLTSRIVIRPEIRSPRQKYIFFHLESAANFPIFDNNFDNFFNWTMTYKLNSDIVHPYFVVKNNSGEVVGPKKNMKWVADMKDIDERLEKKLRNKTKATAWFVSHCPAESKRDEFVQSLTKYLNTYNLTVDIYGKCGSLRCNRSEGQRCNAMLENNYYFYLALENSFSDDYVTEKVLTAVQNNVVPIVYGRADYNRFLPPGSYIDGRAYSPSDLADIMYKLIRNPKEYSRYFKWKSYYTYHNYENNLCALCEALNDKERFRTKSVHKHFTSWWNWNPVIRVPPKKTHGTYVPLEILSKFSVRSSK